MWYKQLSAFWLPSPPSAALLEAALMTAPHMPPAGLDWFNEGFALPQPFSDGLEFKNEAGRLKRLRFKFLYATLPPCFVYRSAAVSVSHGFPGHAAENVRAKRSECLSVCPAKCTGCLKRRILFCLRLFSPPPLCAVGLSVGGSECVRLPDGIASEIPLRCNILLLYPVRFPPV